MARNRPEAPGLSLREVGMRVPAELLDRPSLGGVGAEEHALRREAVEIARLIRGRRRGMPAVERCLDGLLVAGGNGDRVGPGSASDSPECAERSQEDPADQLEKHHESPPPDSARPRIPRSIAIRIAPLNTSIVRQYTAKRRRAPLPKQRTRVSVVSRERLSSAASTDTFHAAFDREGQSLFGVANAYQGTIDQAASNTDVGYTGGELNPFSFGPGTFLLIPFMMFWILYPNWGSTLYGEVRGAGDFRKVLRGMLGGIWVTVILALVFIFLAAKTFGWTFFNAANVNYIDYVYAYTTTAPVIPIWTYPPLLASFLIDSRIIQMIIVVAFGAWFLGWSGTLFLSSTRMIFAAAFDRVLPEAAARVSDRGVPWVALLLIMVPSVIVSWFYAYQAGFVALTLDASLVIAVTFFGTAIAATILPWWKPDIYNNSPIANLKVAGLPLISIGGAVTVIVLGWTIYEWLSNSLYGIGVGNSQSIIWLGILYTAAVIVYVAAWLYRRSQGVDLAKIHAEIPSE